MFKSTSAFKDKNPFEQRAAESVRIRAKFPGKIPIIAERAKGCDLDELDKSKFLCPSDLTVGQFVFVLRKRMILSPEKALFVFVGSVLPPTGAMLKEVYNQYADRDGFLYVLYAGEATFGFVPDAVIQDPHQSQPSIAEWRPL